MDTSDWFRQPTFREYSPPADFIWYYWIAEPTHPHSRPGQPGIFGVAYRVTDQLLYEIADPGGLLKLLRDAALVELYRRIGDPEKYARPEASLFEEFLWNPILQRNEDGTITVQETTC